MEMTPRQWKLYNLLKSDPNNGSVKKIFVMLSVITLILMIQEIIVLKLVEIELKSTETQELTKLSLSKSTVSKLLLMKNISMKETDTLED